MSKFRVVGRIKHPVVIVFLLLVFCTHLSKASGTERITPDPKPAKPNSKLSLDADRGENSPGRTLQELGREEYLKLVRKAKQEVSRQPKDRLLKFPVGTNSPVRIGSQAQNKNNYEVIGILNSAGKPIAIKSTDLIAMFEKELNSTSPLLLANGSSQARQGRQVPVIDLIVWLRKSKEIYLLPKVRFEGVFRDALNSTLNKKLTINDVDMSRIDRNRIDLRRTSPQLL